MKRTIELDLAQLKPLLERFSEVGAVHGADSTKRVMEMLDVGLGLRDDGYEVPGYQPVTLCMPGLTPRRFHDVSQPVLRDLKEALEGSAAPIRAEAIQLLDNPISDLFSSFVTRSYEPGKFAMRPEDWQEAFLFGGTNRHRNALVQELCPVTTRVLRSFGHHITGDASFSVLQPSSVIPAHYGEINFRLTAHLPLVVEGDCGLEAGGERHESREGEFFVFDDGFTHFAWNNSARPRVHLLFMIWNPDVTEAERRALEQVLASMRRVPRLSLSDRLLSVTLHERQAARGTEPVSIDDLSDEAYREQLGRIKSSAEALLANRVEGRLQLLDVYREAGLMPDLAWTAPVVAPRALDDRDTVVARERGTFVCVSGVGAAGEQACVVEFRDERLDVAEAWIPFIERALSGRPILVGRLLGFGPTGGAPDRARELLDVLWREGLLQLVSPEAGQGGESTCGSRIE